MPSAKFAEVQHALPITSTTGISMKQNWKFRVTSISAIPREYMMPDLVKIGGIVRTMKSGTRIAGIEVYAENTIAAGRR